MEYINNIFFLGKNLLNYFNTKEDNRFYYLSLIKNNSTDEINENNMFSIHGLWPQNDKNNYPTYCKKVNFSLDSLKPIIDQLNKYWFSDKEKNSDFWKHEYEKHGSCMFTDMNEFIYFNTTLILYNKAIESNLADKYYNPETNVCLIPVGINFKFIDN